MWIRPSVGIGTGGLGLGQSSTTGQSRSIAALKMAPPQAGFGLARFATVLIAFLILMVVGGFLASAGWTGFFGAVGLAGWFAVWSFKGIDKREEEHPAALAAYERTWLCSRCGTVADQPKFGLPEASSAKPRKV